MRGFGLSIVPRILGGKRSLFDPTKHAVNTSLKFYRYDLPRRYRSSRELPRESQTFYSLDDFFSHLRTPNPDEAHFFFVPLNLIQFQFHHRDPVKVLDRLDFLSDRPDHLLVATADFSQRTRKNRSIYQVMYDWLDKFVLLALESTDDLLPGRDIGIMPINALTDHPIFNRNHRPYLYSFLGKMEYDLLPPDHVRNRMGSLKEGSDVLIAEALDASARNSLRVNYPSTADDYELTARNSVFTLCPAGYGKWTYRFFQAIAWGSIPVLMSDGYQKPFEDSIPYDKFTLTVPESEIDNIDLILREIPKEVVEEYQRQLEANQHHFTRRAFFEKLAGALEARLSPTRG